MLEAVLTGAAAALIGMASGQALVLTAGRRRLAARMIALEESVPELNLRVSGLEQREGQLITRSEVQNAFAQVAQIEAQRQTTAMQQQARAAAVFGTTAAAGAQAAESRGDMNTMIKAQMEALQSRMNRINQEFGLQ